MQKRGWRSSATLSTNIKQLVNKGWIVISRYGGRNRCSLYAIAFLAVDECKGKIDIPETNAATNDWKKN